MKTSIASVFACETLSEGQDIAVIITPCSAFVQHEGVLINSRKNYYRFPVISHLKSFKQIFTCHRQDAW